MASNFCPFCGAPLAPGQSICPTCGRSVAPAQPQQPAYPQAQQPVYQQPQQPAYQQPQQPAYPQAQQPAYQQPYQQPAYQQPQQPAYQQPYQQPAYQQPRPAYQQPYQQPAYGRPAPVGQGNNMLMTIIGASIAGLALLEIILSIALTKWSIILNVLPSLITFFMGLGLTFMLYAYRPFNAKEQGNTKIFSLVFLGTLAFFWMLLFMCFAIRGDMTAIAIFAILVAIASVAFAVLTHLKSFSKPDMGLWGVCGAAFALFFWFIMLIILLAGGGGIGMFRFMYIFNALVVAASAALLTVHFMKSPKVKLF